jgi:WD repeat-containing protein 17
MFSCTVPPYGPPHDGAALRQVQLVPSGCQGWFTRVVGGGGEFFAFASTLAVYVFRLKDFTLAHVLTGHERTITGLSWSKQAPSSFVTSAGDSRLILWDAELGKKVMSASVGTNPLVVEFCPQSRSLVAFGLESRWVSLWDTAENRVHQLFQTPKASPRCMRWSEKRPGMLAVGTKQGQVFLCHKDTKSVVELSAREDLSGVSDLQWDRLSPDYLLVAYRNGALTLFDVESKEAVQTFEKQGACVTALEWMPWEPGGFVTVNGRAGVLRLWNVSQKTPREVVKISDKPAWGLTLIDDTPLAIVSFLDGAVCVYDLMSRSARYMGLPGHIETIFDTEFHPLDPDTLATASYDASVKVWHTPSMRCAQTLSGPTGPLYSLSWCPDGTKLAASSGKGHLIVWDVCTGAVLWNHVAHSKTALRVVWNKLNPKHLVTVSMDCTAAVWDLHTKRMVRRLTHPCEVMGCDWSPTAEHSLATTGADGTVRLFDTASGTCECEYKAHSKRAFNVVFNPLSPTLLATGGDDSMVCVRDLRSSKLVHLHGHSDKGECAGFLGVLWLTGMGAQFERCAGILNARGCCCQGRGTEGFACST